MSVKESSFSVSRFGAVLQLLATSLLLGWAVACSDRAPSSPEASASPDLSASTASPRTQSASALLPGRRPSRAIAARSGSPPTLQGIWGGDHIGVTIMNGVAEVDSDCASGSIDAPFLADTNGSFDLPGRWWSFPFGPTPPNWQPDKHPARYSGVLKGDIMVLTVRLDDGEILQYTLIFRATPRIVHCE